jgi:glucokinase
MLLGIEIGGTKLQLGVGRGDGPPLVELKRADVRVQDGAAGILRQIEDIGRDLIGRHAVRAIGLGFGGPVDAVAGRTVTSHQVEGWNDFPLAHWCREKLGLPAALCNDSDSAGLAEALFGAGKGSRIVFYNNVGSGIGGAFVIDGQLYLGCRGVASELGHLRPGPEADGPGNTVESIASGWGLAAAGRARLADHLDGPDAADLLRRCGGQPERLSGKMLADAAAAGNEAAQAIFRRAIKTLGWALGQMITLLAPDVVVMGGGVPLCGEKLFMEPLRQEVDRYVFPPHRGTFRIVPAQLGEEVVVHGALAIAAKTGG